MARQLHTFGTAPNPPRFKVGDTVGNYKILKHLGYMNPTGSSYAHHYKIKCTNCQTVYEQRSQRGLMTHLHKKGQFCNKCRQSRSSKPDPDRYAYDSGVSEEVTRLAMSGKW